MWNRPTNLDVMNASFWSRLGEGGLGIEWLSEKAAKQALVEPLNAHGVDIDANALAHVVAQSQRYPYFIQLWGAALWQRHPASTMPANGYAKREALNRLGYVWRPPYQQAPFRWHSGIPSLMTHVLKQAA